MTVQELITKLQTMPPEADVIYRFCSDWSLLESEEVELATAEQSARYAQTRAYRGICYRGGRYCNAYPWDLYPPNEKPEYRTVVTLPGN